jgi:hypothetical protein
MANQRSGVGGGRPASGRSTAAAGGRRKATATTKRTRTASAPRARRKVTDIETSFGDEGLIQHSVEPSGASAILRQRTAEVAGQMRQTVVAVVEDRLHNLDVEESIDKAGELAKRAAENVRDYSRINPKLFFAGLATLALGTGLLVSAGRERDIEEYEIEVEE